jgi:nucleoside-diphosphate-sugar epimerase
MKICIVGSTGLVGSALKKKLSENHEVVCLDRNTSDIYELDFNSISKLYFGVDFFINCAAIMSSSSAQRLIEVNAVGALNIAKLASILNAKLIHFSSVSCEENEKNEYFNHYGISKLTGELLIKDHFNSLGKLNDYCIIRCSQIYDLEWKASVTQPFIYNIIKNVIYDKPVVIYGQKDVSRNYVSIQTVVESTENIIEGLCLDSGYILGSGFTISEMIRIVSESLDKKVEITWDSSKPSLKEIYIPENANILSSEFETNFIQDIKEIAEYEKK